MRHHVLAFLGLFIFAISSAVLANQPDTVEWDSDTYDHHFGDINGDGLSDLFLHSKLPDKKSRYILASSENNASQFLKENQFKLGELLDSHNWSSEEAKIVLNDFNGDGKADLWVILEELKLAFLLKSNKNGKLKLKNIQREYDASELPWLKKGTGFEYLSGDFNADGLADLLVTSQNNGKHYLLHSLEKGGFEISQSFKKNVKWGLKKAERLIVADFNDDGRDDVFALSRKKNKDHYIVFADEKGELDEGHQKVVPADSMSNDWSSDNFSVLVADTLESAKPALVRMNNIQGGFDEQGQYWEEEAPDFFDGVYDEESSDTNRVDGPKEDTETCDQQFYAPEDDVTGLTCYPYNSSEAASKLKINSLSKASVNRTPISKALCGDPLSNKNQASVVARADYCEPEAGPPPRTPTIKPTIVGGMYPSINERYTIKLNAVADTAYYELYEGSSTSNYSYLKSISGSNLSTTRSFSSRRWVYYKYRACNVGGCSGFSPYQRIYVYSKPNNITGLKASSSLITNGDSFTMSWNGVYGLIWTGGYYNIKETRPNGSTRWLSDVKYGATKQTVIKPTSGVGTYTYAIQACNETDSYCSGFSKVTVKVKPTPPSSVTASIVGDGDDIKVSWSFVSGATSYQREVSINGGSYTYNKVYEDTSVTFYNQSTRSYRYRVKACHSVGCSTWKYSSTVSPLSKLSAPTFSPDGSLFEGSQTVQISSPENGTIKYRRGSGGTLQSLVSGGTITLTNTETVFAYATKSGWRDSDNNSATFTRKPKLSSPKFMPNGGDFVGSQNVQISSPENGTVKYRIGTSGSYATMPSGGITLNDTATVYAYVTKSGWENSTTLSRTFNKLPKLSSPTFTPNGGDFVGSQNVQISSPENGTVKYRIGTSGSYATMPSGGITLSSTATVYAYVTKSGWENSTVISRDFSALKAPLNLEATPQSINAGDITLLSWGKPINYTGTVTYDLYVEKPDGSPKFKFQSGLSEQSFNRTINMVGTHKFYVAACNSSGTCGEEVSVLVEVLSDIESKKPTVSISSPSQGQIYTSQESVTASVSANDEDGTVAQVEFKLGLSGEWLVDSEAPYSIDFGTLSEGDYTIYVRAKDNTDEYSEETQRAIVVSDTTEEISWLEKGGEVADEVDNSSAPSSSSYHGALAGKASVNGGAASYQIPIALPPGRNGVQPNVSLSYSSRSGLSTAGVGWSLSAGGSISRCPATQAQDGYTKGVGLNANDKLCYNGQRLMLMSGVYGQSGATYTTEIDSFITVTQVGGALNSSSVKFEVLLANGHQQYFGTTPDSRVVPENASVATTWLIDKQTDYAENNHMSFYYDDFGVGEVLLSSIVYTGDGSTDGDRKVSFAYENPEGYYRSSYLAGSRVRSSQRLKTITTYVNETTKVRQYNLGYRNSRGTDRALLDNVEECGFIGTDICKLKTNLTWQDKASQSTDTFDIAPLASDQGVLVNNRFIADEELLPEIQYIVARGDIDGNGSRDWPNHFTNAEGEKTYNNNFTYESCDFNAITRRIECIEADFDLDGRTDSWKIEGDRLVIGYTEGTGTNLTANWNSPGVTAVEISGSDIYEIDLINVADYNGDGWPDVVVQESDYNCSVDCSNVSFDGKLYIYLHTGSKTAPYSASKKYDVASFDPNTTFSPAGDLDGDGLPDFTSSTLLDGRTESAPTLVGLHLARIDSQGRISFEKSELNFHYANGGDNHDNFSTLIDVNGDGLADWVGWIDNQQSMLHVGINKGDGSFAAPVSLAFDLPARAIHIPNDNIEPALVVVPYFKDALKQMDVNGDGRVELIMPSSDADDMVLVACQTLPSLSPTGAVGTAERCGKSVYDPYYIEVNDKVVKSAPQSRWDQNLYRYKALYFTENADGSITAELKDTDLIGGANHSSVMDVFGNGLSDLVFTAGCQLYQCRVKSNSLGLAEQTIYFNRNYGVNASSASSNEDYAPHDLLASISNGAGIESAWTYKPLSHGKNQAFYDPARNEVDDDEHFNFGSSMYVVKTFEQSNGIGGANSHDYQYAGAMYNVQGRGFRGFRRIIATDVANGTTSTTNFLQKFPYSGLVENQTLTETSSDNELTYTQNDWILNNAHSITDVYHLFNQQSISVNCGIGQSLCSPSSAFVSKTQVTTNQNDIDEFGNVSLQTTTVSDNFGIYESNVTADYDLATRSWPHRMSWSKKTNKPVERTGGLPAASGTDTSDKWVQQTIAWNTTLRQPKTLTVTASEGDGTSTGYTYTDDGLPDVTTVTGTVNGKEVSRITDVDYSSDGYFPYTITTGSHTQTIVTKPETGLPSSVTDISGVVTSTLYDALGRVTKTTTTGMPAQYVRVMQPDSIAPANTEHMVVTKQAGVPETAAYIDALGRTLRTRTQSFGGAHIYQDTVFEARGLMKKESVPYLAGTVGGWTEYVEYDVLRRLKSKVADATVGTLSTDYVYTGLKVDITVDASHDADVSSLNMSRTFNALGQLIETIDADGEATKYAYDGQGNPVTIQDANQNQIVAIYDALGRKKSVSDPNMGTTTFKYSDFGEVESETDANNHTISYVIDIYGRVKSHTNNGATATFTWDTLKDGLLTSHEQHGVKKSFTYDSAARVRTTTIKVDSDSYTTTYAYDANYGRLKSTSYPNDLTVGYTYNNRGYQTSEYNAASNYVYREITAQHAIGGVAEATYGDEQTISASIGYSNVSGQMLTSEVQGVVSGASSPIQDLIYRYDSFGNLQRQESGLVDYAAYEEYDYDALHRLTELTINAGGSNAATSYRYDAVGNFKMKTDYSANSQSAYQYVPNTNKISQVTLRNSAGVETFDYDSKGNRTHRNAQQEVWYNAFNKPTRISKNSANLTFVYGADLARYKQVRNVDGNEITTHYIDKHYEVEKSSSGTTAKTYISDIAIITESPTDNTLRFALRDRLGSATVFASESGYVTARRHFDPFGKPKGGDWSEILPSRLSANLYDSDMPTRKGFTDHEHLDEVELIHMNGRVYDYNLGRFLSVDPFIQSPGDSQSMNPYSYLMNNPLSGTDPTGYCAAATGTRIKSCGDMKVEVKVDGNVIGSAVVKDVNFRSSDSVNGALNQGASMVSKAFSSTSNAADIGNAASTNATTQPNNGSTTPSNIGDTIKGVAKAGANSLRKGGGVGLALTPMETATDEQMEDLAAPVIAENKAKAEEKQTALLTQIRTRVDKDGYVTSYKAPTKEQLVKVMAHGGFSPDEFPYLGAFFTLDPNVAGGYANARGAGVLEVKTSFKIMESLIKNGHLSYDPLEKSSFSVYPQGLPQFNSGSQIRHIQPNSYELYDAFNAQ